MTPWEVLGIEATEDERAIKRAYSKLLLVHRPDGDQAAFQRLRWAYDNALQTARHKNQAAAHQKAQFNKVILASVPLPPQPAPTYPAPAQAAPVPAVQTDAGTPPERRLSASEVTEQLIESARRMRDDPAAYAALLGAEPEMYSLDTKLAVSVLLARALTQDADFPYSLVPFVARFFEWDTFSEQRRLSYAGVDGKRLYALLAGLELQNYLTAVPPKGRDKDRVRRWLKILGKCRATPLRWSLGALSLFFRKDIIRALQQGIERFGHPALEQFLGPESYQYWLQLYSGVPTLTQAATHLGRMALLAVIGVLSSAILSTRWGEDQMWIGITAFMAWAGVVVLSWYLAAWILKAMNYGIGRVIFPFIGRQIGRLGLGAKFQQHVMSKLRWLDLIRHPRLQLALALLLAPMAWFWPANVSTGWYLLAVLPFILLSRPGQSEFIAFFVLAIVSAVLGSMSGLGGHLVTLIWPLSCLLLMWGCRWVHRLLRSRWTFERPTAGGMVLIGSGLAFLATLVAGGILGR